MPRPYIICHMCTTIDGKILGAMVEENPKQLVVDLSKVTYIDSSGLAVLIEAMQNVESYGGRFALAAHFLLSVVHWFTVESADESSLVVFPPK